MAEELKTFLLGVDDVRSEESVFHVDVQLSTFIMPERIVMVCSWNACVLNLVLGWVHV